SQIHRMQMACDVAVKQGRKVAAVGRSMQQNFDMAMQMGYLTVPEGLRIRAEDIGQYPPHEIAIVTTGSQGEPLAGLSRMANDDHRHVRIQKGDTVVLSATPIPGNEDAVWRVVNNLIARGADVIYDAIMPVHVSGHGYAEELKLVLNVTDPQYVIPVHGEPRMLLRYSKTAQQMGWLPEDIFRLEIGDVLELDLDHGKIVDRVASGSVLVDGGSGSTGVHEVVLRDRQHLAEDGFVVVVAAISAEDGALMSGPEILTRGFVYVDQSEDLLTEATEIIREQLLKLSGTASRDLDAIQGDIRATLRKLFEKRTNRRPLVMPLILEY
ncbi:MAG: ribonuclease J, partial [bacterium]